MSYCIEQCRLLRKAGTELAESLLPAPFILWMGWHDTGHQPTIVAKANGETLYVWRGSEWFSSIYELNDQGHRAGLQPDFGFAKEAIDKFFADLTEAVERREAARIERQAREGEIANAKRLAAVDAIRSAMNPQANGTAHADPTKSIVTEE